jgi:hypothetical protein
MIADVNRRRDDLGTDVVEDMPRHRCFRLVAGVYAKHDATVFHFMDKTGRHVRGEAQLLDLTMKILRTITIAEEPPKKAGCS